MATRPLTPNRYPEGTRPVGARREGDRRALGSVSLAGVGRFVACVLIALVVFIPLVVAVLSGFRTNPQLLKDPIALPNPLITTNYGEIVGSPHFWQQVFNSVLVMILTTVMVLSLSSAAAFVIARKQFPGR